MSTFDTTAGLAVNLTRHLNLGIEVAHRLQPDPVEPDSMTTIRASDLDLRFNLGIRFD
ncbi:MAG TPA: hypothetical protein RMG48_05105 [Myxococcales bacterium LLY-WYZ-16_1]|nr:hypothetical protein [Myxococcales bacterium LLY-WYZ-16_1]